LPVGQPLKGRSVFEAWTASRNEQVATFALYSSVRVLGVMMSAEAG
jgi:hypothetical protein